MQHKVVLRHEIIIHALPSKVWAILTQPEYSRQYLFDSAVLSDWTKGSPVILEAEKDGVAEVTRQGSILDIVPGILLQFELLEDLEASSCPLITTYELLPQEDGVRLRLLQEIYVQNQEQFSITSQNWNMILQKIKWLAEYC